MEFYKAKSNQDGHNSWCKLCNKHHSQTPKARAYQKRFRESERGRQYNLMRQKEYRQTGKYTANHKKYNQKYYQSEKGKKAQRQGQARHRLLYPDKMKAINAVNNAIRYGKLARPDTQPCLYCPKPAQQYHHHKGYTKEYWLDVVPACRKCHRKLHLKKTA